MKGLIVKFEDKVCKAGIPDGGVSLLATIARYNDPFWSIGGLKKPNEIHQIWNGGMLKVGDRIEIEFAEFDEASEPVAENTHSCCKLDNSADDDPEMWKHKLDSYYELKKVLEERIIEKE
ncbi:hypothetical protein [Bacteroides faecalis]|uniref:Uncharacterized protein n=1 Tax=Bacteroides faecalis TaxID=2447885 RepID=A0A401LY94_9BACE|nr:hypothetical protein [Bacteroides faecalis]GCB36509.1 hypothetical protein KGMB02408_34540 [Bacteroides faecalis]